MRLGVVGTGFVSRNFVESLVRFPEFVLSRVLTRRPIDSCTEYPKSDNLTNSIDDLVENSDLILECSGDPVWATEVIETSTSVGLAVVTMNAEFHVTTGSFFVGRGLVTEAEGDQPGCQAALREEALELGFTPLVYGNMKGFLNREPGRVEMEYWANRHGISLPMVIASTDGTKVQIEQALVANGLGATIVEPGLVGPVTDDLEEASWLLAGLAETAGEPIADYVLSGDLPHGVFIVARNETTPTQVLRYLKLGEGPYYTLVRNNIFVHLELIRTIKRVAGGGSVLLDNSDHPRVSVATVAKRELMPGTRIPMGMGSFEVRGEAVMIEDQPNHLPIGLTRDVVVANRIEKGQVLTLADVELPDTLALRAWNKINQRVNSQ